jgi:hypothetical protein
MAILGATLFWGQTYLDKPWEWQKKGGNIWN